MAQYVKLKDVYNYPIRLNHFDRKNGNLHFILGIETVMEYIDYLPRYEFPEGKPINRYDFERKETNPTRYVNQRQWDSLLTVLKDNGIEFDECGTVATAICQVLDMDNPEEYNTYKRNE